MTKENVDSHIKDIINYPKILNKVKKKKIALNNVYQLLYTALIQPVMPLNT